MHAFVEQDQTSFELLKGTGSENKDQSYFLCRLNQTQLQKAMFPIGELDKAEVRQRAERAGLITHDKKDSTGICFIGEQPFRQFLSRYIPPDPGNHQDDRQGNTIGTHEGVFYYTLGQRQGLGIGGVKGASDAPWYVVQKNIEDNELIVAQDHDHPLLHSHGLTASKHKLGFREDARYSLSMSGKKPISAGRSEAALSKKMKIVPVQRQF